jgi:hypothetical protein
MAVANARNGVVTTEFTREWVLVGSTTDFPGDFGRNVLAGTVALGVVVIGAGVAVLLTAGKRFARWAGLAVAALAAAVVLAYRDSGGLLGARPSAAAVLLAVALFLWASSLPAPAR